MKLFAFSFVPMDFRIESATEKDITPLVAMINRAYRGEEARSGWTHEADLIAGNQRTDEASLRSLIHSGDGVLLRCTFKETICGCVYLQHQEGHIYLGMLTVDPLQQGNGIGKKLLRAAEDHAKQHGFGSILMTVISLRTELIEWYQRHGYQLTAERRPFPGDGRFGQPRQPLEFVVLKKDLAAA